MSCCGCCGGKDKKKQAEKETSVTETTGEQPKNEKSTN
jgi:hypothetical protein